MGPFLCLGIVFFFSTLSPAQGPEEEVPTWRRRASIEKELQRIKCDDEPVPFKISLEYYKYLEREGIL
jgi:hypothetical protein